MHYLIISILLFSNILLSKEYTLKWYNFITILDNIEFEDKSIYRLVRADGSREDNEGFYGSLKCAGPNKISSNESEIAEELVTSGGSPTAKSIELTKEIIRLQEELMMGHCVLITQEMSIEFLNKNKKSQKQKSPNLKIKIRANNYKNKELGDDLLSHEQCHTIIGAESFHF